MSTESKHPTLRLEVAYDLDTGHVFAACPLALDGTDDAPRVTVLPGNGQGCVEVEVSEKQVSLGVGELFRTHRVDGQRLVPFEPKAKKG